MGQAQLSTGLVHLRTNMRQMEVSAEAYGRWVVSQDHHTHIGPYSATHPLPPPTSLVVQLLTTNGPPTLPENHLHYDMAASLQFVMLEDLVTLMFTLSWGGACFLLNFFCQNRGAMQSAKAT